MSLSLEALHDLPSPFYRVAVKVLIFDDQNRLLVTVHQSGNVEIPGGGWEHDETLELCVQREIDEEVGLAVTSVSPVLFVFRGQSVHGWQVFRAVVRAEVAGMNFRPGDDMQGARFVTKDELLAIDNFDPADAGIVDFVDQIWPPSGDVA